MSVRRLQNHQQTQFSTFGQQCVSANHKYVGTYTTLSFCSFHFQFCDVKAQKPPHKDHVWLKKIPVLAATNLSKIAVFSQNRNITCSRVLFKLSSGVIATRLEMQSWTVVTGLAVPLHLLSGNATLSGWKNKVLLFLFFLVSLLEKHQCKM